MENLIFGVILGLAFFVVVQLLRTMAKEEREERDRQEQAAYQAEVELSRQERSRDEKEAPVRSVLWLFKYVAKGDRQFTRGEQQRIFQTVAEMFPEHRSLINSTWFAQLSPDHSDLPGIVKGLAHFSREWKDRLVTKLEMLACADGKKTLSEASRIRNIQVELGLLDGPENK